MNERGRVSTVARGLVGLALSCCVIAGCSQSAVAPRSTPLDRVEATLVDRGAFDAVLSGVRGKVVLVDHWASWCGPCIEQLPRSVELTKRNTPALALVTLNFDDPDAAEQVGTVLAKAGANAAGVTNLQSKLGSSSESMDAFEIASGALPNYKLFDRQGKLRGTFELDPSAKKQYTPADVDAAVAKLLAE
jgi:thiol-disulfide isomerase/thioredoxin